MYRGFKYRARVVQAQSRDQLDRSTVVVDWHEPLAPVDSGLTLQNAHRSFVYRNEFQGRLLEIPIVEHRATRIMYAKLRTSSDPRDPADVSVQGSTPEEIFERITHNYAWLPYLDQFVVEPLAPLASPVPPIAGPDEAFALTPDGRTIVVKKNY
jgi:hypothetical protein